MIYLNGEKITHSNTASFSPTGPHVDYGTIDKKLVTDKINIVEVIFDGAHDLWKLAEVKAYLDNKRASAALQMHYFPYAHNMPYIRDNARLEAQLAVKHINSLQFAGVRIADPQRMDIVSGINKLTVHQFVAPHLQHVIEKMGLRHDVDVILFPSIETANQFRVLPFGAKFTHLISTHRNDYLTGKPTERFWQFDEHPKVTAKALIVTDVCDDGSVYDDMLLDLAYDFNIHETYLLVTHLVPGAVRALELSTIKHVFASNSTALETATKTTIIKS